MNDLRIAAWSCLRSGSPTPLREVDAAAEEFELDGRDRGLLRRLVGTEVRRRGNLRAIVKHFLDFRAKPDLIAHLHLGVVQLLMLDRVPDHAAVSETCGAVQRTLGQSKVRYANAILRNVLRARKEGHCGDPRRDLPGRPWHLDADVFRDPEEHPLLWCEDALGMPAQVSKRWVKRLGQEAAFDACRRALEEPPLSIRTAKGDRDTHRERLKEAGVETVESNHPALLIAESGATEEVVASAAFADGELAIMGETALRAAELVQAREGERLLDLCAAPGGKTSVLAGVGAEVTALDLSAGKLPGMAANLARLGLADRVRLLESDGTAALEPGETFDGVIVDAPCSNTGVLSARPGARWRFGKATMASLDELQARLLKEGAARVRPGGRLVWSTCSVEPEENERRIADFLTTQPGWSLEEEHRALSEDAPGPVDGGASFRLRRAQTETT